MLAGSDWKLRHQMAQFDPSVEERTILDAIKAWRALSEKPGLDYTNRDGWALMGEALRWYLNYDWGGRLDMGLSLIHI